MDDKRVVNEAAWNEHVADLAQRHNAGIRADAHEQVRGVREELLAAIEERLASETQRSFARKNILNELQRQYMVHGWHDEAIEVATLALEPTSIDATCPNREAIVQQSLGRSLVEAGRLDEGRVHLLLAKQRTLDFMALVEQGWERFPDGGEQGHAPGGPAGAPMPPPPGPSASSPSRR